MDRNYTCIEEADGNILSEIWATAYHYAWTQSKSTMFNIKLETRLTILETKPFHTFNDNPPHNEQQNLHNNYTENWCYDTH